MKYWLRIFRVVFIILAAFIVLLLSQIFFQQDEWHSFGVMLGYGTTYLRLGKSLLQLLLSDRFGSRLITYGLFSMLGANSLAFGVLAGGLHILNSWLVYLLAHKLTRDKFTAILSSFFFLINAVSHQAYSWFGTVAGSATSVTFILVSILYFLDFIQKRSRWAGWLSILTLWMSFLFKETGYFLFLWFPILWLVYQSQKISWRKFIRAHVPLALLGFLMTFTFINAIITIPGDRANYVAPTSGGLVQAVTNSLRYAVEGTVQAFLPAPIVFETAKALTTRFIPWLTPNTPSFDLFYTTTMAEVATLGFAVLFVLSLIAIYKKVFISNHKSNIRVFLASLIFLPLSFMPYSVLNRFDAYLDSRYYYAPAIGAALLFGVVTSALVQQGKKYRIVMLIPLAILTLHTVTLINDLFVQIRTANERRQILAAIQSAVPTLPAKGVFFVSGNSNGFYALPELKVPFQSGLGHVLMVLYARDNQLPKDFFVEPTLTQALDGGFLYDTISQGYKEIGNRGFGYFYDQEALDQMLNQPQNSDISVFSFFYDADTKRLTRIKR